MKSPNTITQRKCLASLLLGLAASLAPAEGSPAITSLRRAANGVTVAWTNPAPGQAYTLQVRNSLGAGSWSPAPSRYRWPILATRWTEWAPPANAARFYRVMAEPVRPPDRGKVLSATLRQTITVGTVQGILNGNSLASVSAHWPVRFYKLQYETVDPFGLPILASGAFYVPEGPTNPLPLLSYQHGTLWPETVGPSSGNLWENSLGVMFATSGYVILLPDHLGIGDSPGLHPYLHAQTEATTVVDMLRATRTFCATNGIILGTQLFLAGYSQGGHSTMAAQREIESGYTNEFSITASAPMAGAYDLSGVTLSYLLTNRSYELPALVPYTIAAYLPIYQLADTLEELLVQPYDRTLAPLLDGSHGLEMNSATPRDMFSILRPEYLQDFLTNSSNALRLALRDNDLYRWTPRAPMHLYHCRGDAVVPYANSLVAYQSFTNSGASSVALIDVGPLDHGAGYIPSVLAAKQWFDTLKQ